MRRRTSGYAADDDHAEQLAHFMQVRTRRMSALSHDTHAPAAVERTGDVVHVTIDAGGVVGRSLVQCFLNEDEDDLVKAWAASLGTPPHAYAFDGRTIMRHDFTTDKAHCGTLEGYSASEATADAMTAGGQALVRAFDDRLRAVSELLLTCRRPCLETGNPFKKVVERVRGARAPLALEVLTSALPQLRGAETMQVSCYNTSDGGRVGMSQHFDNRSACVWCTCAPLPSRPLTHAPRAQASTTPLPRSRARPRRRWSRPAARGRRKRPSASRSTLETCTSSPARPGGTAAPKATRTAGCVSSRACQAPARSSPPLCPLSAAGSTASRRSTARATGSR